MDFTEIITVIVGGIVTIVSVYIKTGVSRLNKKLKDDTLSHEKFNERVDSLEKKLEVNSKKMQPLNEYIIKKSFSDSIPTEMKDAATKIKEDYFLNDREMDIHIDIAVAKIADIIKNVMKSDFPENTPKILKNELIGAAKSVRANITTENFNSIQDVNLFKEKAKKDVILPAIELFCEKTEKIMHKRNGTRLQAFKELSIDFVQNLVIRILEIR